MKKLLLIVVFLLLVIPHQVQATCEPNIPADLTGDCKVDFNDFVIMASDWFETGEPNEEWVARYNGPGNSNDSARAIAVDSSGNVYITGDSRGSGTLADYATIKYDPNGNQLWDARYNGPGNDYDWGSRIDTDYSGNVYVTGISHGSGTDRDYATIKYDANGNEVWVARYNGPSNYIDQPEAIAIDASSNIYITGVSYDAGINADYATIKYDPNGEEFWVARYDGPNDSHDWAYAITLDDSGNVYVTGESQNTYTTIKYDPNGNELWVARYNGPEGSWGWPVAIATDSTGNIYITGNHHDDDYVTVKYDPNGDELWVAVYNGPGDGMEYMESGLMAIDNSDNIYVTGASWGGPGIGYNYATVKYDTNGNELWVARNGGQSFSSDWPYAIATDSSCNVYVAGIYDDADYGTIKYDPNGNELWLAKYNGPDNDYDGAFAMYVDVTGNAYVTGFSESSSAGYDYATTKYPADYTCTPQVTGDLNHNCKVDIYDLNIFCQSWLECNLEPPEACW